MSGITIASNIPAGKSALYVNRYQDAVNKSIERLSSGKKVNSASDAPGEIGYINRFRSAIESTKRLNENLQDNISMLQTADYSLSGSGGISSVIATIREKVVEAQNITLSSQDKQNLQQEIEDLIKEVDDIATTTEFNTKKLLNGAMGASFATSSSDIDGYAVDRVESNSYHFENITGATMHEFTAGTAPSGSSDITGADYDYTKTLGVTGTVTHDGTAATVDGRYEILFTSSSEFDIYNNSTGVKTASGTTGNEVTVDGVGITVGTDGTYAQDYKLNFSLSATETAFATIEEGNRGASASTSLAGAVWGSDAMMNSYFDIKFDYDNGTLKYAAFDSEDNRMGSWVASGSEFEAYDSSNLNGSKFTFTSADAGIGDVWRVQFGTYTGLNSAGGTFTVGNADDSFSVSYTGDDRLSDVISTFNSVSSGVATAELDTSSESDIFTIKSDEYGEEGRLSLRDSTGDFISTLSMTETSGSGEDAQLEYEGRTYDSSDGFFRDIEDNVVFQVAHESDVDEAYVSVSDTTLHQATNINGPDGIDIFIRDMTAKALGLENADGSYGIDITTSEGADEALAKIDSIQDTVSYEASKIGSLVNRLSSHTFMLSDMNTQYESTLSRHEDTDITEETTNYFESIAGRDAASAMYAQANLQPQRVMELLGLLGSK
jgi:flagellin